MKKNYEKPEILIEDYNMTELFATSPCEQKVNFSSGLTCHSWEEFDDIDDDGNIIVGYLFSSGNASCNAGHIDDAGVYDGICYHAPEDNNFFTS